MAAGVMLFALAGSIVVLQMGFKALDTARKTTLAAQVIQSEMERIRLRPWAQLPPTGTITLTDIFPTGTATQDIYKAFTATRTVSDVTGKVGEMKKITVTVTWNGLDGQSHTRSTDTIYCKDGLNDYYYTLALATTP